MRDLQEESRIGRELTRVENGPDPFSAAVRATRMPMLITDPRQQDNPIVFANAAFARLTGFERAEIIGRNCRFLQGPETDMTEVSKLRTAIAERVAIELELLNYRRDGSTFWNRLLVSPVFGNDGELTYFFASQFDVTLERERLTRLQRDRDDLELEVAHHNQELQASEQRLRFALKAGRLGSWSLDLATDRLIVSEGCKEIFGRPNSEPFTHDDLLRATHPDDCLRRDKAIRRTIDDGVDLDIEYRIRTGEDEERWIQVRGQASYRADGTPLALGGVIQDVTELRRADEHRALLADELSHRVRNTLATFQAIASQTLHRAGSLGEAAETLSARIRSMVAANDLLVRDSFEGAPLRDLLHRTLAPFGIEDEQRFQLDGPDVRLPTRLAVAFALGLHELATNASKYGALSTPEGQVILSWEVVDGWRPHRLHFSWVETGGPPVAPPVRVGFGTQLIRRVLARDAEGEVNVSYEGSGVVFTVVAPLPAAADDPA